MAWDPAPLPPCLAALSSQDGLKPEGIDKHVWLHRKMKNTNSLTEYDLAEFENIGAIGLDLWQVSEGAQGVLSWSTRGWLDQGTW